MQCTYNDICTLAKIVGVMLIHIDQNHVSICINAHITSLGGKEIKMQ